MPTSALQRQLGGTFSQLISGPSASQRTFETALPQILAQLTGTPGADILSAAQPIFARNLQLGADTLRQSGPRFASATEALVGQQGTQALQDFNLFQQQVLESGRARQLQAADLLGRLAGGADTSLLQRLGLASEFSGQQQALGAQTSQFNAAQQAALLQALLQAGLFGGGLTAPQQFVERPSTIGQITGLAGGLGSTLVGLGGGGGK